MNIHTIVQEVLQTQVLTQEQHHRIGTLLRNYQCSDADLKSLELLIKALVNKTVRSDSVTICQLIASA